MGHVRVKTYTSKLITLHLLLITAAESPLINQIRQLLLHHLFDLLDCRI
jgi:hypothetical protein